MSSRIEVFEQMLQSDPENTMVLFGLAKEYEKAARYDDVIATLTKVSPALQRRGQRLRHARAGT
jgi:cytochrome c-type biogenesis protein CcmH/NrfG